MANAIKGICAAGIYFMLYRNSAGMVVFEQLATAL